MIARAAGRILMANVFGKISPWLSVHCAPKVKVPAVVPVEKTMFGWPLIVTAVAPAFTAKDAMRLEVTTN